MHTHDAAESIGEAYFDHYSRFFREPVAREIFRGHQVGSRIQVLAYENVFPECLVFASLGVSHYANTVGQVAEVLVAADDGLDAVPRIIANALFYVIENGLELRRGTCVGGIGKIAPSFALAFGKTAIYFTSVQSLPVEFELVNSGKRPVGTMLMGVMVSAAEEQLLLKSGIDALESRFESAEVDPFAVRRPSAV